MNERKSEAVTKTPKLLDLFCGAGGAGEGYARAGFDVTGVDINPQPRNPHTFIQGDALKVLLERFGDFDAFHASPPCQAHTNAQKIRGREHADFIPAIRAAFLLIGKPFVIENVPGAPLLDPIELCGCMFGGLKTYRPRLFETSFRVVAPGHAPHRAPVAKMGRPAKEGQFMHVVGNFSGVENGRRAMGIDWMTRDELREAIPPVYTKFVGRALMEACNFHLSA